jgi:hypothetical protein
MIEIGMHGIVKYIFPVENKAPLLQFACGKL